MNKKQYHITHEETIEIVVGSNVLSSLHTILETHKHSQYILLSTQTTKKLFGEIVRNSLGILNVPLSEFVIADGEVYKDTTTLLSLLEKMTNQKLDRKSALIALGGGVVGDIATVAAGLYFRGIDCIQIPTTLLAQVDASIGGKGAVNLSGHKNTIGIIRQPRYIIIDTNLIKGLPKEQLLSGIGEIAKYAIAVDENLFNKLTKLEKLEDVLSEDIIATCVALKMDIVQKDPFEEHIRKYINFGHTFGHSIELSKHIPHGLAVSIGMVFAITLSVYKGLLTKTEADIAIQLLHHLGLPTTISNVDKKHVYNLMKKDKKAVGGKIKFVLLEKIGKVIIDQEVSKEMIRKALSEVIV